MTPQDHYYDIKISSMDTDVKWREAPEHWVKAGFDVYGAHVPDDGVWYLDGLWMATELPPALVEKAWEYGDCPHVSVMVDDNGAYGDGIHLRLSIADNDPIISVRLTAEQAHNIADALKFVASMGERSERVE